MRILFACLGNICRSPTAEAVLRQSAAQSAVAVEVDSAGTQNWHMGKPPYGPMQEAARARGYDMAHLAARQVCPEDFLHFDLIIAMDPQNMADLQTIRPRGATAKLATFTDYTRTDATEVPDPYYTRDFNGALDLIELCTEGLIRELKT